MKLAYFSPFNPQPSGISDYSEELLPYLAAHAEIELFVDGFQPSSPELLGHFRWHDYKSDAASLESLPEFDAIVYHMGNDHRYHSGIVRVMRAHPGVVVFHDFALQDFFLGQAHDQGDMSSYLDELEVCHGQRESAKAEEYVRRGATPPHAAAPLTFPLNAGLARGADGIIVHSEWSRERLAGIAPGVPVARINHHITAEAAAQDSHHQDDKDAPVRLASFGLITPDKGIERALRALASLCNEFNFHYTLVGSAGNFPELSQLIERYDLRDRVTVTGHVSLTEFEKRIAETDIAVNLRERPVGATSGSLCRIMAAGVPAIVSNVGAFTELPDNAVVKVEHDQYADALLEAYLRELIENPQLRRQIGKNARRHVRANHNIEKSAARYVEFLREVIERRPRKHFLDDVARECSNLGFRANDEALLRGVAAEVALIASSEPVANAHSSVVPDPLSAHNGNRHSESATMKHKAAGRLPKIEGLDYKRAAVDYPRMLDAERNYYLRTKPFYNLANKPLKHTGDGMDPETHRHFTDFANMAVALALPAGARILDVGCGSGWLSEYFARLGYQMTGIDISDDLIQMARERVERIPYKVDHETPLNCRFLTHDIESSALDEEFDAVVCYDSLHHFVDEHAVMRHLSAMVAVGGLLFILEGDKPDEGSTTEEELIGVMQEFGTLESPFSKDYLRAVLDANGFVVVGDYLSISGLFEREMLEGANADRHLPLRALPTNYHYMTCIKVANEGFANLVPDSRKPASLNARITLLAELPPTVAPGSQLVFPILITNAGDTLWLNGQTVRAGVVMPGVRVFNSGNVIVHEFHGQPMLPRAIAPTQSVTLSVQFAAPTEPGRYTIKIDLVDQHVCWFEEKGSEPLVLELAVDKR